MTPHARALAERLAANLRTVLATRLRAVIVYGAHAHDDAPGDVLVHVLAVVASLTFPDLEALARSAAGWRRAGLATPFLVDEAEFARSLDAFPIEFGAMLAHHVVVEGEDPFAGLRIDRGDLRRACEVQVRSHLLHLREGFLETSGEPGAIRSLVANSAPPLHTLLVNLARLAASEAKSPEALAALAGRWTSTPASVFADVLALPTESAGTTDAARLFPDYLAAIERLTTCVDQWVDEA
jgi:hypothetical protein